MGKKLAVDDYTTMFAWTQWINSKISNKFFSDTFHDTYQTAERLKIATKKQKAKSMRPTEVKYVRTDSDSEEEEDKARFLAIFLRMTLSPDPNRPGLCLQNGSTLFKLPREPDRFPESMA